ncbi:PQQ-dependent catabolism-associated beta-propeller protein [Novosphingobium sp. 1949]|uniref:PQQ-dependent catabolism-associated beta-propeller protein n=1 Tax=Novosphingobium organovorum TaxID=2930092 RepID=A0ABT0BCH3_9SPHN|nr:PQQ-dependent catabolism-associated beta-propeller protein [Novosphingobium organovorum]MCJ2182649.1 PQQ-dependent catabolism-associated beta-propeller protein [Novosphingobium organovorum]
MERRLKSRALLGCALSLALSFSLPVRAADDSGRGSSEPAVPTRAYVSNERSSSVTVVDLASNRVIAEWPVGQRPRGIAMTRDGKYLLICVSLDNAVEVRDPHSGALIRTLPSGADPEQFFPSHDGRLLFVANEDNAAATAIDLAAGKVAWQVAVGEEPEGIAQSPDGKWLLVTSEEDNVVAWVDTASHEVVEEMETDARVWVGAEMAGTVHIADVASRSIVKTLTFAPPGVPAYKVMPCGIRFTPDGKTALVALGRADAVAIVDVASATVRGYVAVGERPWHLAIEPDGRRALVANGASDTLSLVDIAAMKVIATIPAGKGPWGVALGN